MEETEDIRVTRPVYNQFQNILMETQLTSNSLMKHFFQLYNGSLTQISSNDPDEININNAGVKKGDNYSKVVVNIPRRLLRRDISVNVTVPDIDPCNTSDSDDTSEDTSTSGHIICRNTELNVGMDTEEVKGSLHSDTEKLKNPETSVKEFAGTNQQQTYNCKLCIFKTKGLRKFKNHVRKHSEKQLYCHFCEKVFLDKSHLNYHVKTNHGKNKIDDGGIKTVRENILICNMSSHDNGEKDSSLSKVEKHEKFAQRQETLNHCPDLTNEFMTRNLCRYGMSEMLCDESGEQDKLSRMKQDGSMKGDNNIKDNCQEIRGDNWAFTMQNEQLNGCHDGNLQVHGNCPEAGEVILNKSETENLGSASLKQKLFICRLCGALFSNGHFYRQHKYRCVKDKLRCVCKCKRKFQWRSQFLHHKAKCALNNLYRQKERRKNSQTFRNGMTKIYFRKHSKPTSKTCGTGKSQIISEEICTNEIISEKSNTNEMTLYEVDHDKSKRSLMELSNASTGYTKSKKNEAAIDTENHFNISCPDGIHKLSSWPASGTSYLSSSDIGNNAVTSESELSPMPVSDSLDPNINPSCHGEKTKIVHQELAFKMTEKYHNELASDQEKLNIALELSRKKENIFKQENNSDPRMDIDLSCVKPEPVDSDDFMDIHVFTQKGRQSSCEKLIGTVAYTSQIHSEGVKLQSDFETSFPNFVYNSRFSSCTTDDCDANVKCEECGEIFKRKAYLKEHMEGKHGGDLRYTCDCGKKFKWRSSLGSHRKNCYQALMSVLPPEGHAEGQNVSVIDFSQCAIPYMNMQNEWIQEIEKMTKSVLSQGQGNRQRHLTSPEMENQNSQLAQRRKSDSILRSDKICEQNSSLRINTASVKPFAEALSRYKQKEAVNNHGDTNPAVNNHGDTNSAVNNFGDRLSTVNNFGERNPAVNTFGDRLSAVNNFGDRNTAVNNFGDSKPAVNNFGDRMLTVNNFGDRKPGGNNHGNKKAAVSNFGDRKLEDKIVSPSKINTKNVVDSHGVVDLRFKENETHPNRESYSCITNTQDNHHYTSTLDIDESYSQSTNGSHVVEKGRTAIRAKSCDVIPNSQMQLHQKRKTVYHPNTDAVECTFCKEKFTDKDELEKHKLFCKHLQDTCSVCGKMFRFRTDLVNHLLSCHGNDETLSCFCGLIFSDWNMLEKHCNNCLDFKTQSAFFNVSQQNKKLKLDRKHSGEPDSPIKIDSQQTSDTRLTTHQWFQTKKCSPQEMNVMSEKQQLPEEGSLQDREIYSKPVSRSLSNHHFDTILQKQNYHVTQAPLVAEKSILPTISSFVSSAENLAVHKSTTAITHNKSHFQLDGNIDQSGSTAEEICKNDVYVCTFCGNIYNSVDKFTAHNEIHHSANLFPLDKNKQVKSAVDVAINKARHLTSKIPEHVCHLCGDVFAAKAYLKEHISGKHGTVDRYTCACGMKFKWRSSLGIHQKRCPKSTKRTYNRWNSS